MANLSTEEESELWKLINAKAIKENPSHPYPDMVYPAEGVTKIKREAWMAGYIACMEDVTNPFPKTKQKQKQNG